MPLETATLISDLVTSNPAPSDGLNNADDHMRLIKGTVKATFANVTGAVTASHTDLNATTALVAGTLTLATPLGSASAPGHTFAGDSNTGMYSPGADQLAFTVGGAQALAINADKSINAAGPLNGPGAIPIGGMIMWLTDTLPTMGTWCWANGGTLPRTGTGAALFALWGTTFGAGDGSTTFNVINMQEVVPVGKSTMGGASSPGLLTTIATGVKQVLGSLFGSETHTLTIGEMPLHSHPNSLNDPGHSHSTPNGLLSFNGGNNVASGTGWNINGNPPLGTSTSSTGMTITNANAGGGAAHSILGPSRTVNFIIRIG